MSGKQILFAAIHDEATCSQLDTMPVGSEAHIVLGSGVNACTESVDLDVTVIAHGRQEGTHMYGEHGDYGPLTTVQVKGSPIFITITNNNHSFVEEHRLDACGVDWRNYDVIVVKQGYIHPELKAIGALSVMSLTDGATPQNTKLINFKRIMRPMFPIDEI